MEYDKAIIDEIRSQAIRLKGDWSHYDTLIKHIRDAQIVLLGESTHGTHEFYEIRSLISKRLIVECGFHIVALESDWPDTHQINRYIHQEVEDVTQVLASFDRFPTWMWRNKPMLEFIEWLKNHNREQHKEKSVSLYGLDLYSLYRSIDVIINELQKIDPAAAAEARYHYSCFDNFRKDPQLYGYAVFTHVLDSCADKVIEQLVRLQNQTWQYLKEARLSADDAFYIEQNARVVQNAEHYYRALFIDNVSTWNIRDSHMLETLNALIKHYTLKGINYPKIIIWAHNSHIGNAAATQMGKQGEHNIGQLAKEQFGTNVKSIGFTTYEGTVTAASDWHGPVEHKQVRKALPNSYEYLFHETKLENFLLFLKDMKIIPHNLLERAIGVVYRPQTERISHYFYANLIEQFDVVIHCDKTRAVEPLEKTQQWIEGDVPETYPSGL